MSEVFLISDTHFGHKNILKFKRSDGTPLRSFVDLDAMHMTIALNWNRVVANKDKVYHLGDVAMTKDGLSILQYLNGKKRLVRGNHDRFQTRLYMKYFQEIYGVRQINGIWLSHCPMHLDCVDQPRVKVNAHGHLHANVVDHPKYRNVCVEQIGYTPIPIDEVLEGVNEDA